jgi:uncharacterized membrane protein YbaN (DUF454 family)
VKKSSHARNDLTEGMNGQAHEAASTRPQIEIDAKAGTLRINDARLFAKDRRTFGRRLVEAVAARPGVKKTTVDLASGSCRVEFAPRSTDRRTIAGAFAESVREATAASLDGDGTPWWQPSTNWVALTAYSLAGQVSLWETLEASPGRIRIRHQGLSGDYERLSVVADALSQLDTVISCKAIPWSHRLTIDFNPDNGVADWFVDQAERTFETLLASETQQTKAAMPLAEIPHHDTTIEVASGPARWLYLALGGSALVMTVVGLIVPGIPTVPFLLLSSYGFARSSPRMNHWLRETRFFGPILVEWEQYGGLSQSSKKKLIGLTVVIVLVAIILGQLSPLVLVLILVMASLSAYGLSRMPGIPGESLTPTQVNGPVRLALPGF